MLHLHTALSTWLMATKTNIRRKHRRQISLWTLEMEKLVNRLRSIQRSFGEKTTASEPLTVLYPAFNALRAFAIDREKKCRIELTFGTCQLGTRLRAGKWRSFILRAIVSRTRRNSLSRLQKAVSIARQHLYIFFFQFTQILSRFEILIVSALNGGIIDSTTHLSAAEINLSLCIADNRLFPVSMKAVVAAFSCSLNLICLRCLNRIQWIHQSIDCNSIEAARLRRVCRNISALRRELESHVAIDWRLRPWKGEAVWAGSETVSVEPSESRQSAPHANAPSHWRTV